MVSTTTKPTTIPPENLLAEQRVIFSNISWQAEKSFRAWVQQEIQSQFALLRQLNYFDY